MDDAQFTAWLAQHGGEVGRKDNEREVDDPSRIGPDGRPLKSITTDSTTVTAADGASITIRRAPGWSVSPDAPQYTVVATTPPRTDTQVPGNATPRIEGTPTGADANGQPTFDNSRPIMVSRTPDGKQVDARPLQQAEREQWEREQAGLPPAAVVKAEADKAAAARQAQIDAETRAQNAATATRQQQADARQARIDAENTAEAKRRADAANEPQVIYREVKNADGSTRNVQVRVHPGGREEIVASNIPGQPAPKEPITARLNTETGEYEEVYRDPATGRAAVRVVPREGGTPGTKRPAPTLPQIVVGQSQDALRTAYTQIQEEVDAGRRTAAWGENRRQEVYAAAELSVREADLIERSRQANQTTSFNVASTVLGYGQSSLENALKFTLSINDKLKPGSGSGGKMFAALFNMQMKMAKDSGIYDLGVPRGSSVGSAGQPGAPTAPAAQPPRLSNPGDPAAVEADHQRSQAELEAIDAAGGPRTMTPSFGEPGRSNVPGIAPAVAAAVLPPPVPSPTPPPGGPAVPPPPGGPAVPPPPGGPAVPPPIPLPQPPAAPAAMPATGPAPGFGDPGFRIGPPGGGEALDPGFRIGPPGGGEALDPGFRIGPPGAPQGMAAPPALDALRQQFASQPAAPQIDPAGGMDPTTGGIGIPPALQRAQIASTPPWRLPPDQLETLIGQFDEDTVFNWPGRSLLGGLG